MKRFLGFAVAMFFALVAIALVGGDAGAVAGHGCHGARKCHGGGLLAKLHSKRCHGERERCHGRHHRRRCHGQAAPVACEAACDSGCSSGACGGEVVEGGCASGACGGEVVEGGCAGGACGGEAVISEGVPTEAAPEAPAAPKT